MVSIAALSPRYVGTLGRRTRGPWIQGRGALDPDLMEQLGVGADVLTRKFCALLGVCPTERNVSGLSSEPGCPAGTSLLTADHLCGELRMTPWTPVALKSVLLERSAHRTGLQTFQWPGSLYALKNHQGPQGACMLYVCGFCQHLLN